MIQNEYYVTFALHAESFKKFNLLLKDYLNIRRVMQDKEVLFAQWNKKNIVLALPDRHVQVDPDQKEQVKKYRARLERTFRKDFASFRFSKEAIGDAVNAEVASIRETNTRADGMRKFGQWYQKHLNISVVMVSPEIYDDLREESMLSGLNAIDPDQFKSHIQALLQQDTSPEKISEEIVTEFLKRVPDVSPEIEERVKTGILSLIKNGHIEQKAEKILSLLFVSFSKFRNVPFLDDANLAAYPYGTMGFSGLKIEDNTLGSLMSRFAVQQGKYEVQILGLDPINLGEVGQKKVFREKIRCDFHKKLEAVVEDDHLGEGYFTPNFETVEANPEVPEEFYTSFRSIVREKMRKDTEMYTNAIAQATSLKKNSSTEEATTQYRRYIQLLQTYVNNHSGCVVQIPEYGGGFRSITFSRLGTHEWMVAEIPNMTYQSLDEALDAVIEGGLLDSEVDYIVTRKLDALFPSLGVLSTGERWIASPCTYQIQNRTTGACKGGKSKSASSDEFCMTVDPYENIMKKVAITYSTLQFPHPIEGVHNGLDMIMTGEMEDVLREIITSDTGLLTEYRDELLKKVAILENNTRDTALSAVVGPLIRAMKVRLHEDDLSVSVVERMVLYGERNEHGERGAFAVFDLIYPSELIPFNNTEQLLSSIDRFNERYERKFIAIPRSTPHKEGKELSASVAFGCFPTDKEETLIEFRDMMQQIEDKGFGLVGKTFHFQ